jgi:outer membrane receptor for ferrienterochelin and colicin
LGGKLPPKSTIREIRINQNPFSAEYDRIGMGRIEILTKPGTDKFRGDFGLFDSDAYFNSRNPYVDNKADYSDRFFYGILSGALSKRASFFFNGETDRINNDALIHAVTLDGPVQAMVVTPSHEHDLNPRLDYQLSTNHTRTVRWDYSAEKKDNNGIGQYSLQSRAYNNDATAHEVRVAETAVLSPKAVNDIRFAYDHNRANQYGTTAQPALVVSEAFSTGGDQVCRAYDISQRYEVQDNTSVGARQAHLPVRRAFAAHQRFRLHANELRRYVHVLRREQRARA